MPAEWEWSRSHPGQTFRQINCGILGGTNVGFIQHYARSALDLVQNPRHSAAWASIPDKEGLNPIIEQFFLLACLDFHRFDPAHPSADFTSDIYSHHLKPLSIQTTLPAWASRTCSADAKKNAHVTSRLEQRTQREDMAFYQHCLRVTQNSLSAGRLGG